MDSSEDDTLLEVSEFSEGLRRKKFLPIAALHLVRLTYTMI